MKNNKSFYQSVSYFMKKYPNTIFFMYCVLAFLLVVIITFLRYPNNLLQANFYAEDGKEFMANIINFGVLTSLFQPFNGYFIVGLYLLSGISYALNYVLFNNLFLTLPMSNAITGYCFFAFCIVLPVILFRKQLGYVWGSVLLVVTGLIPLISYDYAILGTIGNLKWIFFYLAFVLTLFRIFNYKTKYYILLIIDLLFLICAYTNANVYLLYPLFFVPYGVEFYRAKGAHRKLLALIKDKRIYQTFLIGVLLIPQIVYIKIHGLPTLLGYLDTPFQLSNTLELFGWRIYLYQFFYPFMGVFSNKLTVACLVLIISFLIIYSHKLNRIAVFAGLYAIFLSTVLLVINRPGISEMFAGYKTSGPDQFFYPQNLIMWLVAILVLAAVKFSKLYKTLIIVFILLITVFSLPLISTFGRNNFMAKNVGTFEENLKQECVQNIQNSNTVAVQVYPEKIDDLKITVNRDYACKGVK